MTPPEAMLWSINLTALLEVNLCRVSISPPISKHCNCSEKFSEKPVQSNGGASLADNQFGPELLLTQGDIAEGDVFNVTWTGFHSLARVFYRVVTILKKDCTVSV